MIDRRSDGAAVHEFIGQDTGYQCERSFVGDVGERRPDQIDLAHALGLDRVGPLLVGRLLERAWKHVTRRVRYGSGTIGATVK
jgi:hypothetical protein